MIEESILKENFKGNIFDTAAELRVSVQTIMSLLNRYDITFDKPKHIYSELKKTNFSVFQKNILIGSILGDGHLEKRSHLKNALFREEHSVEQVEWLKWKYENLKPFTTSKMWNRDRGDKMLMPDGKGGKKLYNIQQVCSMATGTHPYLTELHGFFYKNGLKIVPRSFLISIFNVDMFWVWVGDDGYYNANRDYVVLCTENFSYEDVLFLKHIIELIGIVNVSVIRHSKNNNSYRIYINNFSYNRDICIKGLNILPKCMHHKISLVPNEHQVATH